MDAEASREQPGTEAERMHFQYLGEDDFVGVVERITGRKVRAFVSGMDTKRDVASELFYLVPVPAAT
jgi:hypothetical protein